ncbi:hypothetical protein PybrP1_004198 [[Pythium] brassicae (nom. inval.)]|nr:hypothetical protein PybrP1_004198 [[Pythium] brassicae (nom. inval.)]
MDGSDSDASADERRNYVVGLLKSVWGRHVRLSKRKESEDALAVFLDDPRCSVLQARLTASGNDGANSDADSGATEVELATQLQERCGGANVLLETVFVKTRATPLTPETMRSSLQVTTLAQSPLQSLYQAVHQVYAPMLLQSDASASQLSQKLKDMLMELDLGLGNTVLAGSSSDPPAGGKSGALSDSEFTSIVTINDEFQFWERADAKHLKRAKKFCAALDNVHQRFCSLEALSFDDMAELLEESYNTLDDIWRADLSREHQYPQARMDHLLGLVGAAINAFVLAKAQAQVASVWTGSFHDVDVLLQQSIALCEAWAASIETLTSTMWPSFDEHPWTGKKSAKDAPLHALVKRLEEVARIRTTYEELVSLLPRSAAQELAAACFQPFARLKPLYYNPYTEAMWQKATKEFEATLAPVEVQVGGILRAQIASVASKPSTAVRLLQRYKNLLQRPSLAKALAGERDALLAQLLAHLDQLESDFETRRQQSSKEKAAHIGKTLSPKVNAIVWGHMLSARVVEMGELATHVLSDLPAFKPFAHHCEQFLARVNGLVLDKVRDWQEAIESELEQEGESSLRLTGKLMQIDKNGDLVVNYSEFLVTLLRDVRQLTELAAQHQSTASKKDEWVPPKVRKVAEEAEKYYRYGVMLKKVANFYNNMESQIIDEQKPMLLDSLLAFEDAVKRPGLSQPPKSSGGGGGASRTKDVTWQNLDECNEYVRQLQEAADKLSAENRRFKRAHEKLGEEFLALMDVDLLRHPTKWKERWDEIKRSVLAVTKKQDPARTKKWFLYWDHQLYKVLESGYQLGLEMLNENLPEIKDIKTELHFPPTSSAAATTASGLSLLLKPPIEELRTTYYKAMKKFVSRPTKFSGFANPQVFATMCDANASNLVLVYQSGERLFSRVEALLYEYEPWSLLARVGGGSGGELDALMEAELQEPGDWEVNLKTLKLKRKESEKIPDFVKIDCVHLSLVTFKSALDEHLQRFQDGLLLSLRKSAFAHIRLVEDFVEHAKEKLNARPRSIDEISQAQVEWKAIEATKAGVHAHFDKAERKKALLLGVLGASASARIDTHEVESRLAKLPTEWENFEVSHEAFNEMIEDQRESLKGEIAAQVEQCNEQIVRFRDRWSGLRLLEVSSWDDADLGTKVYKPIADESAKLGEIKALSKTLTDNCRAFNMDDPVFSGLDAVDSSVGLTELNWSTYKQFRDEVQALAAQDWFTFSTNVFALQDCAQKWAEQAKQTITERTMVVDKIADFHNRIKRAMPTLKLCRGEPFKDDHWTQLFRKLGMPRSVDKINLTLGHFVDAFETLEQPATLQFVKVLHARAQGEVTIRDALLELRAWTETAELSLLAHEHDGRRVAIIKDWKDVTLALGDNQSLLASLKESQFFKPFEMEAQQYEAKMSVLDHALSQLNVIQRKWVFLEPIFSKGALPSEQSRFRKVDDQFTDIMASIEREPKLFNLTDEMLFPQLVESLNTMVDQLERCQKALADFLEEKRSRMPRFYFIGDEDLLEILGQSQNPAVIQNHLKKLYQGVHRVEFSEQKNTIVAMLSAAGEKVVLQTPVQITSAVEEWLETFTEEMRRTIRMLVGACVANKAPDFREFPSQVLCLAEQIRFCEQVEAGIANGSILELKKSLHDTLRELTSLDLSTEVLMSLKVKALVLDLVHHIDVCEQLLAANCRSPTDWIWQKQLRFYLEKQHCEGKEGETSARSERLTPAEETEILIKAVRINTLSKLTFVDSTRFLALIGDVFPGVKSADLSGGALGDAIRDVMVSKPFFLQADELQIRKMLQLKESLDQRMGCVVVGPSGSGKSTVWQILQHALIKCGQLVKTHDMDIKRLVSKWLLAQAAERRDDLSRWIDELFTRALDELHKYELVVETTTVGTIMNGLSHVASAATRSEFACAMVRGLGANLAMGARTSFAKAVFMMANERPPDMGAPLDCYCEGSAFVAFETKRDTYGAMDGKMDRKDIANCRDAVVPTVSVQRGLKIIEPWVDRMEPFILVGPEGSGKNMLIRQAFRSLKSVNVTVLHCNAQTTADHIIHKISQCCSLFSTNAGRVYRPRDCERLVLYLKDINLPKPDQYDTCMLIAFLQQLLTFNGFYDQHLEFLGVEKIQIVASMNAATTVGRHPLSTRFTAIVKVAYMDYPTTEELMVVYSTFLEAVFDPQSSPSLPAQWRDAATRDRLARSIVEVYDATKAKFTVDEQRHYLFTPRDLSKWVFAFVRYDLESEDVLDVLANEARRLFRDRLVDADSTSKFDGILNSVLKQQWKYAAKLQDVFFSSLHCRKAGSGGSAAAGDDAGATAASPLFRIASDEFSSVISQAIVLYEREEKDLHVLLFDEILDHLATVERILSEPGGSMLLVGSSGVGRRSATTLIAYMLGYTLFSPSVTRHYDAGSFRADLKSILVKAGVEGQHYVVYLEDHHFTQDAILEITNSLLSSGEVPGLYTHEEIEPLIAPLKEKMLDSIGASGAEHRSVYDFFVSRVCQFVHVVVSLDARHPQFLLRCESNPALYTRCAIVWMGEWSALSMKRVPELLLAGSDLVDSLPKTNQLITSLYESCKELGATPREFVGFLGSWRALFEAKCKQIVQEVSHLKSGLHKLEDASATVDELSKNATVKKKELGLAQVAADNAMKEIQNALDKAAVNRREVEELKKHTGKAEEATNARKKEIERELSDINPILQSAKDAVGNIKSDNLNEIRSLKMPPEPIHDVLSAVLMLLGIQDTSWNSMKKFLGNRAVKDDILNYDSRRITPEIFKAVTKLVKSKASSFDHETIYRVSVAAAPLATWVKANLKYSMVLNKIEPLEADLAEAKRSLEASQQRLAQCEKELASIDVVVARMRDEFGEKTREAQILTMGLEAAQSTLNKAQGLLGKLGGEKQRWSEQVKELDERLQDLPIRMLLAAAFTTFLGKCSEDARARVAELAKDTTRPLSTVQSQDARFVSHVEQAVRFGKTLVVLEVDTVEPYLYPLVRRDLVRQGPRFVVALGDKVVDYNENFRLYLVTRNPSPPLAPDALAIVNVVNFTVTKSGLEGQLLGVTIQHEQPELEQEKSELLHQEESCKMQLAALEKELVEALATSEGDILENTILIESLTKTKSTSAEIERALEKSATKSEELDEKRETYRPFAREGAKLFFLVKQLSAVNHMYRFSLAAFLALFRATLGCKMESASTKDRILRLIPILELKVLMFVGRALFKEHRTMFGLHLVHGMHPECFETNEYEFFCGEAVASSERAGGSAALPEWASLERKEAFALFVETLPRLAQQCKFDSHDLWVRWAKSSECEQGFHAKMDKSGSAGGLSAFQKLLVVQALRPDRLQSAIVQFVCGVMQLKSLTPPPLDFKDVATEEASNATPVLLLTTAGADPSKELEEVASAVVGKSHYFEVAMGGGQQEKALSLLKSTAEHGEWLCLQNLHLVVAWLPTLEKEINVLAPHHKFRLWLTTEPHDAFPLVLLEQSIKITFESPPGMKKNLQRTYASWGPEFVGRGSAARAQLLFLLAFFHALLQERRTYLPQGWTKFYEFSFGDFRAGANVMELASKTSAGGAIDWPTLHGLMENAIYGGRIDNPYDLRVLRCNLNAYFSADLLAGQRSLVRGVKLPQSARHEDYVALVDRLPDSDTPAVFGLPDNIERSMQRTLSADVIAQLKALSASEAAAQKFDREKWRAQLGPLLDTWTKLTASFHLDAGASVSAATASGAANLLALAPTDAFVALENEFARDLVQQVNSALVGLKKVLFGTGLLTPAIQTVAAALLKGAVPSEWSARWEGSESVATWMRSLAVRRRALSEWQAAAASGKLLSRGLDMSELLHPGTFLNALRQQSARELRCSMDGMQLLSCWEKDKLALAEHAKLEWFEITRLLLQGASFEGGTLVEAASDAHELAAAPSCFVAYARDGAPELYAKENCLKVPLYYSTNRERVLAEIAVPISGDHARWVLAGVALFLGE